VDLVGHFRVRAHRSGLDSLVIELVNTVCIYPISHPGMKHLWDASRLQPHGHPYGTGKTSGGAVSVTSVAGDAVHATAAILHAPAARWSRNPRSRASTTGARILQVPVYHFDNVLNSLDLRRRLFTWTSSGSGATSTVAPRAANASGPIVQLLLKLQHRAHSFVLVLPRDPSFQGAVLGSPVQNVPEQLDARVRLDHRHVQAGSREDPGQTRV
jgi:hypothetical protein